MDTFTIPLVMQSAVLLLVRVLLAVTFFAEARHKFKDMKSFAKQDGLPLPAAYLVAIAELCAALGMLSGVLAQWAGVGVVVLMLGTTSLHIFKWHSPYWASKKGWEYDVLLLAMAAVIVAFGPGEFTVLNLLGKG